MPPEKKMRTEDKHLVWTDDKSQLLLEITRYFKAKKAYAGVYWESINEKYETFVKPLSQIYPKKQAVKSAHSTGFFTRERIASKIKQTCAKYRKPLDAGWQIGDLGSEIWSGSLATEYMPAGLKTLENLITPIDEDIVVGNLISFWLTNVVTVYDTLLIIPEMDALDIPKHLWFFYNDLRR